EWGLSTRVFESWAQSGVPEGFIAKLRPLEGRFFPSSSMFRAEVQQVITGKREPVSDRKLAPFHAMTWRANRPDAEVRYGPPRSISAKGWGGQYLIMIPAYDLVVARLRAVEEDERGNFGDDVNALLLGVERPRLPGGHRALKVLFRLLAPVLRRRR